MTERTRRVVFLVVLATVTLAIDQASKRWAIGKLAVERELPHPPACDPDGPVELRRLRRPARDMTVVEGYFDLHYVENCGGAWGLLGGTSERFRFPFFLVVSIAAMGFIVSLYMRLGPSQRTLKWALPLVLGGAVGNLVDRLSYRYVVDFILWHLPDGPAWPTFNVADAAISVGVGLLALDMIVGKRPETAADAPVMAAVEGAVAEPADPAEPGAEPRRD